jgi:hypothetical protein
MTDTSSNAAPRATPIDVAIGPLLPASLGDAIAAAIAPGASETAISAMHMALQTTMGVSLVAVIHYGTSKDSHMDTADIDLLALASNNARGGVWGKAGPHAIDLHLACAETVLADDPLQWSHVAGGQVLFDTTRRQITAWMARLADLELQAGRLWSASDKLRDYVWAYRMVDRIERRRHRDPVAATLYEAALLSTLAELQAQASGHLPTSLTRWCKNLSTSAPALSEMLEVYVEQHARRPDPDGLRRILAAIWPTGSEPMHATGHLGGKESDKRT